jgi:phage repressor protein C with HTH and peptisase S24 domain
LIYIHPGRRPRIGDYVLIELQGAAVGAGPAFVKRLKKIDAERVVVEQLNPPGDLTFDRSTVKNVFKVLTTAELMGA